MEEWLKRGFWLVVLLGVGWCVFTETDDSPDSNSRQTQRDTVVHAVASKYDARDDWAQEISTDPTQPVFTVDFQKAFIQHGDPIALAVRIRDLRVTPEGPVAVFAPSYLDMGTLGIMEDVFLYLRLDSESAERLYQNRGQRYRATHVIIARINRVSRPGFSLQASSSGDGGVVHNPGMADFFVAHGDLLHVRALESATRSKSR